MNSSEFIPLTKVLAKIIDNRGKSVPAVAEGFPLIATNCIKESSIYPTFENIRYVDDFTLKNWFRAHIAPNDILFVNKGTPGRVCLVPDPVTFCAAQDMIGLRANRSKINYKYLFAVLRSNWIKQKIHNYHVGLVIPHFKKQDLDSILIPQRTPEEQESIGNLYISLSEKIELNNKINQELEAMAKTLYDYWFVQFDFPNEHGKPYKSSGGKMVYSQELKWEIPEGWEVKKLGDYASIKKGKLITEKTADSSGKVKVVSAGIDFSYYHSEANYSENTITISASGANAGFINFWREPIFACDCTTVRSENTADTLHILGFLKMRQEYLYKQARGSAQPHVYPKDIEGLTIPIPPRKIIEQFGKFVVPNNEQIANNLIQNQQLTELRDWLLPMLMNGQVTIQEAEERLSIAAEPQIDYKESSD